VTACIPVAIIRRNHRRIILPVNGQSQSGCAGIPILIGDGVHKGFSQGVTLTQILDNWQVVIQLIGVTAVSVDGNFTILTLYGGAHTAADI